MRVVETAGLAPAPFGCMILADLGAEVIRVERGGYGGGGLDGAVRPDPPGRQSIALDLRPQAAGGVLDISVETADVLVEGFRPGVTERLGIGPDDFSPQPASDLRRA